MRRRAFVAPLLAVPLLIAAGCGTATIKPEGAAQSVADIVSRQTGFHPTDVRCPSDVEAKVGNTFTRRFTGPDGNYVAEMRVTKVDGERVIFAVRTHR